MMASMTGPTEELFSYLYQSPLLWDDITRKTATGRSIGPSRILVPDTVIYK